ncbi:MAG: valyl-tRNA synthetase [Actinomycetota bacterium]|jgi:valyl-tRNA synthetase
MTLTRLLVAPAVLAGEPDAVALRAAGVAAERRFDTEGETELIVGTLEGDLASQHAVESELAREGLDRTVIGRDAFVERVRETEARHRSALRDALTDAGIPADIELGRTADEIVLRAARIAFVRLYDAGLLEHAERVVDVCARCQTVVEPSDAAAVPTEVVRYTLALDGVEVAITDAELLPGVVAVAVPAGHAAAGTTVRVPLGHDVPVLADDATEEPWFVVPAHAGRALDFARQHGLTPVPVLDSDGVVVSEGPLGALARYAARAAAAELLRAEGVVLAEQVDTVDDLRCGRCATSLTPVLGPHWFLRTADLEIAAADAIRGGAVQIDDVETRDRFVDRAERADSWCLSHQVWAGDAVPAARCIDCGQIAVTAEPSSSCGKCMGELVPTEDVLDARFIAALWPLALAGWPVDEHRADRSVVFAGPDDVTGFALPVAALGLRLAGAVPYDELVSVHTE